VCFAQVYNLKKITFKDMPDGRTVFSCGCVTQRIGGNFMVKPHSVDCEVFKYIIEESRRRGNLLSIQTVKSAEDAR